MPTVLKSSLILFFLLSTFSFFVEAQSLLIGKWKRVDKDKLIDTVSSSAKNCGNLELRVDSTFQIEGDSSTHNSQTPGWHVCEAMTGNWELNNKNNLTLWLAGDQGRVFLRYKIILLTKHKLVLRSQFSEKKQRDIIYSR